MNSRAFNKMFLLLVVFVVLVLVYLFIITEPRNAESLQALNKQIDAAQKAELPTSNAVEATPAIIDELNQDSKTDEVSALLDELQPHQYHPDPFIEARTVAVLYSLCSSELNSKQWIEQQLAENNHVTAVNEYAKHCAEAQLRYPQLLSLSDSFSQLEQIPSTSNLGQLIKQGRVNYDQNYPQMYRIAAAKKLKAVLKSQNAALLAEESMSAFMYFQYGEIIPVSTWLSSQDIVYNSMVTKYALSKMACRYQQGAICDPLGLVSWVYCIAEPAVCGLDFETIYQMHVMPGMQKDVDILISRLEQFAESS